MSPARALLSALTVLLVVLPCSAASAATEPVRQADDFVDSIGVMVHMTYMDTAYNDRDRLIDILDDSGIRHVRDGLSFNTQYAYDSFNQLADRGIRTTFIMGDPSERRDTLEQLIATLKTKVPGAAEAVEGPNEYSYSGDRQWAPHLRTYQERLYSAVKGDAALSRLPVLAPSLISPQDHFDLGNLTGALDFGNKHSYPSADLPEGNIQDEVAMAGNVSGNRPVYVTESGYHNALNTDSGHRPISEAGAATYLPRMYLEYFRRGIPRTFAYELIDEWRDPSKRNLEANFGLLRNDYSEKPAFRNLKNLIALLDDAGASEAKITPLDFTIPDAPADLRKLVLQKRDGSHYVVLWRAVRVWDPVARKALTPDRRTATLQLALDELPVGAPAEVFSPSTNSTRRLRSAPVAGGIPVSLGADPVVIKLPPGAAVAVEQPAFTVTVPPGQRIEQVLGRGLVVRCRSTQAGKCNAAARGKGKGVIGKGKRALRPRRSTRVRMRTTRRGRTVLRRAIKSKRGVIVKLRVDFGRGRVVTKRVWLRR